MYEKSCASSNHIKSWKDIDFGTAEYEVKKLQMRIAKAVKEKQSRKNQILTMDSDSFVLCKSNCCKKSNRKQG